MLESQELLKRIRDDPPPTAADANLGFKLVQAVALTEIAEALCYLAAITKPIKVNGEEKDESSKL